MKITQVPLQDIISLPSIHQDDAEHVGVFDELGTDGCLLDCDDWRIRHDAVHQRTTTPAKKREKRDKKNELAKASIRDQRQALQIKQRVPNRKLKSKRDIFTLIDLGGSAAAGCECCKFFNILVGTLLRTQLSLNCESLLLEWIGYGFLLKVQDNGRQTSNCFQLFSPSGASTRFRGLMSANLLSGDTSSIASFNTARGWIRDCETTHTQCGPGCNVPLPKRCLDLRPLGAIHKDDIRLTGTEGISSTYACLSHCWGEDPKPIQTTSSTLKDRLQLISFSALPQTFQDAVAIARELGLRYLWIDSLCIIQDSAADWEAESSKMADIYHNSYLTIAAISSPDSRGGCFSTKRLSDVCFCVEVNSFKILIAARYIEGDGIVNDMEKFGITFPALTRAWIYQERMLSRRMLYYTHQELQFECREHRVCECGNRYMPPHPVPGTVANQAVLQAKAQYAELERFHGAKDRFSEDQMCQHWQKTVMQYTKLHLTKTTDKLPALSGCAKDIGRFTGDVYIAGLWKSRLADGLLWVVNTPVDQPRAAKWRAPSWSWASVDTSNGIDYIYPLRTRHRQEFQDRMESAECVLLGADKTGSIKSGYLRLRVSLCPVYLRRICRRCMTSRSRIAYMIEYDQWLSTRSSKITPCPADGVTSLNLGNAAPSFFPDYKYDDRTDFDFQTRSDGRACRHARVFLVHLYDGQSFASSVITDIFLVLRKMTNIGDVFERKALFKIEFQTWEERDRWFQKEYRQTAEDEALITIV